MKNGGKRESDYACSGVQYFIKVLEGEELTKSSDKKSEMIRLPIETLASQSKCNVRNLKCKNF